MHSRCAATDFDPPTMAGGCCNLRCFSYFVAILSILGGVLQLIKFDTGGIVSGILGTGLGCLLFDGILEKKEKWILGYVITVGVCLVIALIFYIVALMNVYKVHLDPHQERVLITVLYVSVGPIVISFLFLIPVFAYYKQLSKENDAQPRPVH